MGRRQFKLLESLARGGLRLLGEDREEPDKPRCLPCHFQDEERLAMRYLPAKIRKRLLHEHGLIKNSFKDGVVPYALLKAHADFEDKVFPRYLPSKLVASFLQDHDSFRAKTPTWDCASDV